jgi:sugar lactone lactonase YvrE
MASSTCNGDSNYQSYPEVPQAAATTLCGMRAEQMSILEGGAGAGMATDSSGNLYTPDYFNNRILRYNDPFASDTRADAVWGQADFSGHTCNRGRGHSLPDARSLCLAPSPGTGYLVAGVAIDAAGNLWATDNQNHRVLRFPFDTKHGIPSDTADLVLGQPDFYIANVGQSPSEMDTPNAVRVDTQGHVFVADSLNHRVLHFAPPFQNGMPATTILSDGIHTPAGLEFAPDGSLWVNNTGRNQLLRIENGSAGEAVTYHSVGGIGIDRDGNLHVASASFEYHQGVRFRAPDYSSYEMFFDAPPNSEAWPNTTTLSEMNRAYGIEVTNEQLIASDGERLLFWNEPWNAVNGQTADGVVGVPDANTLPDRWSNFGRMRADKGGRLWVIFAQGGEAWLKVYQLPLTNGAEPLFELRSPLQTLEGEPFVWSEFLSISGIAMQESCDCVWLSDSEWHRVIRIRNASSDPVIDMVIGQRNVQGTQCNQGRDSDQGYPTRPDAQSLCAPGGLSFDVDGNLYLADHNLEDRGNKRLLVFSATSIASLPKQTLYNLAANRIVDRNDDFSAGPCPPIEQSLMCSPLEPAFLADGRMIVGMNGYSARRFPVIFDQPADGQQALNILGDYGSMPTSIRTDPFGNVYVLDHNRTRVLIYRNATPTFYTISGRVIDTRGQPVAEAKIAIDGMLKHAYSDSQGRYTIAGLPYATYRLRLATPKGSAVPEQHEVILEENVTGIDFHFTPLPETNNIFLPMIR